MPSLSLLTTLLATGAALTLVTVNPLAAHQSATLTAMDSSLGCLPTDLELPQEPPAPAPEA